MTATHPRAATVPGPASLPIVGHTVPFLRDALRLVRSTQATYGDAFRLRVLGREVVVLVSPDATRDLYLDRSRALSSEQGWAFTIGPLFARGLMLRDFDDHHRHRLVLAHAFRRAALVSYVSMIDTVAQRHVAAVGTGPVDAYGLVKRLMLDVAANVFVGAPLGPQAERVNADFVAMMRASLSPLRWEAPGTPWRRGMAARRDLVGLLTALTEQRRSEPERADLLSRLAHARDDAGRPLPTDEVVDHMAFLLLAAHDTTTATVSVLLQGLARHPAWQDRVTAEVAALDGEAVTYETAGSLVATGLVMREAMRLQPPVPFSPRVAVRDVTLGGVEVPAGTTVSAASLALHRHPAWWSAPDAFDPDRFAPGRAEDKQHSHLYVPFGGGAHLCIGNHLAELMAKVVVARLLAAHRVEPGPGSAVAFRPVPIPRPRRPLVLQLVSQPASAGSAGSLGAG